LPCSHISSISVNRKSGTPIKGPSSPHPVRVDEPEPVSEDGLKLVEVRGGAPLRLRLTLPANSPEPVIVTVYIVADPGLTDWEVGEALMEKSALLAAFTTSVTLAEWFKAPLVAATLKW
jgi:hypothetical protein